MSKSFEDLLAKVAKCSKKTVSVACAQDKPVLEAVKAAKEKGIADAILVGDEAEIRKIAAELDMNLDEYEIINEPDSIQAAHKAVELVHNNKADMYMNGIPCPKVAPLAAVEVVNPKMPVTVDAAELTKMNENGEITGCIVDGPLSLDLAIDPEAAKHKGAEDRKIVGDADILLFPDIHAGNLVYKCLTHTTASKNGCILTGTKAPVILTSRSDSFEVKMNSIALAAVVAEAIKNEQ